MLLIDRVQVDPVGDLRLQLGQAGVDAFPDLHDVLRGQTGDAERERLHAVEPNDLSRVFHAFPADGREVVQVHDLAAHPDRQAGDFPQRVRTCRYLQLHPRARVVQDTGFANGVGGHDGVHEGQRGHILADGQRQRWFNKDGFFRQPRDLHVGDAVYRQDFASQEGRQLMLLSIREALRRDGIEDAVDIPVGVVDQRLRHAIWQIADRIADPVAQAGPDVRHLVPAMGRQDLHRDDGYAGHVDRCDGVDLTHLLDFGLQRLGHLLRHLHRRGAGVQCGDHGRLDRESRVFQATDAEETPDAAQQAAQDQDPCQQRTVDRAPRDRAANGVGVSPVIRHARPLVPGLGWLWISYRNWRSDEPPGRRPVGRRRQTRFRPPVRGRRSSAAGRHRTLRWSPAPHGPCLHRRRSVRTP